MRTVEGAKFCEECGLSFATIPTRTHEQHKTVTVLFCDLIGSTELGESTRPPGIDVVHHRVGAASRSIAYCSPPTRYQR